MIDDGTLAGVLDMLRVRGAVMGYLRANAPWGLSLARARGARFHAVTSGACWVRVPGHAPRELLPGDVVLLPTGAGHVIASHPTGPARPWDCNAKAHARNSSGEIMLSGPGGSTEFICAAYDYDGNVAHPLLSLLPPTLFVSGDENGGVRSTLYLLHHELTAPSAGSAIVVNRLIDVLFVNVVRAWIAGQDDQGRSWLLALRNPSVARALAVMHADPGGAWTTDRLARESNLSRATLIRHFTALVGEPPLAYLTRWRMELAARQLRETDDAVGAIARRVGYTSEFAFSRAFTRLRGRPPGRYRIEARRTDNHDDQARALAIEPRDECGP